MPTYDYRCDGCGHEMAVFHGITEDARKKCPQCREDKLRRLIGSGAGIIFKGSGFYETDYKRARSSARSDESKTEGEGKPETPSSESKSDKSGTKDSKSTSKDSKDPKD